MLIQAYITATDFMWEGLSYTNVFVTVNGNYTSYLKTSHKSFYAQNKSLFLYLPKVLIGNYRLYLELPFRLQWEEYILAKIQVLTAGL
jgi:hypothetical protein